MRITKQQLGDIHDTGVFQYILENDAQMKVRILTLGASIQSIELPFSDGTSRNVVLSYDNWNDYIENPIKTGATLAPNAGRIAEAKLPIGQSVYPLSQNEGRHNSHGGFRNASLQNWAEEGMTNDTDHCSITLSILLPDGLDGYPGDRMIHTRYSLTNDNTLSIHYHAETNKLTYLNLSNHTYFNLSGDFNQSGLNQFAEIDAAQYVINNQEHIPVAVADCSDSPFDFHSFSSFAEKVV